MSVRKGHTLLTQLVVSGEVPLALTVYNYKAEQLKKQGAPIDWFVIGNAIARPNGIGVARKAPHPHAPRKTSSDRLASIVATDERPGHWRGR